VPSEKDALPRELKEGELVGFRPSSDAIDGQKVLVRKGGLELSKHDLNL
jgi:hypothetical protein